MGSGWDERIHPPAPELAQHPHLEQRLPGRAVLGQPRSSLGTLEQTGSRVFKCGGALVGMGMVGTVWGEMLELLGGVQRRPQR